MSYLKRRFPWFDLYHCLLYFSVFVLRACRERSGVAYFILYPSTQIFTHFKCHWDYTIITFTQCKVVYTGDERRGFVTVSIVLLQSDWQGWHASAEEMLVPLWSAVSILLCTGQEREELGRRSAHDTGAQARSKGQFLSVLLIYQYLHYWNSTEVQI